MEKSFRGIADVDSKLSWVVLLRAIFHSFGIALKRPYYMVNGISIRYFSFDPANDRKL